MKWESCTTLVNLVNISVGGWLSFAYILDPKEWPLWSTRSLWVGSQESEPEPDSSYLLSAHRVSKSCEFIRWLRNLETSYLSLGCVSISHCFFSPLLQILNSFESCLIPQLSSSPPDVEAMRIYLILPEFPLLQDSKYYITLTIPLAMAILRLDINPSKVLGEFIKLNTTGCGLTVFVLSAGERAGAGEGTKKGVEF